MPTIKVKAHKRNGRTVKAFSREIAVSYHQKIMQSPKKDWREFVPKEHQSAHIKLVKSTLEDALKGKRQFVKKYTTEPYKDFAGRRQHATKEQANASYASKIAQIKRYKVK